MNKDLSDVLKDNISIKEDKLVDGEIEIKKLTFLQLRDAIWRIGRVVTELEEDNIYIAAVKSGMMKANTVYLAIKLMPEKLEIVGYAKEGLFNQNAVGKAIKQLKDVLDSKMSENEKKDNKNVKKKRRHKKIRVIIFLAILISVTGLCFFFITPAMSATHRYNEAVKAYNEIASQYEASLRNACIDNIEGIAASAGQLEKESEGVFHVAKTVFSGNTADKIDNDTATIYEIIDSLKNDLKVVTQISNPSSDWVMEKLKQVSQIKKMETVSENNDPNQMLGKDGGYTSCIYFTISDINSDSVEGDTVVAKGTDAGGAIEVFGSVEDAEARCEYLSGFDNTLMYSGSYAIVGTMVIRTSYRLDSDSQFNLTNDITEAFTRL